MATGTIKKGRTLLWENTTSGLAENTQITLSSANYNYLLIEFRLTWQDPVVVNIVPKGGDFRLFMANVSTNGTMSDCLIAGRHFTRVSDTVYTAGNGGLARLTQATVYGANFVYPIAIYGIE